MPATPPPHAAPIGGHPVTVMTDWIRPWYPAGATAHADVDCPDLLLWEGDPQPGPGWLNPKNSITCETCVPSWDAECKTCSARLSWDDFMDGGPFTRTDAERWESLHQCQPTVRLIPPPVEASPGVPDGQTALFPLDLQDAAA